MTCAYCNEVMEVFLVSDDAILPPFLPSRELLAPGIKPESAHRVEPTTIPQMTPYLCLNARCRSSRGV